MRTLKLKLLTQADLVTIETEANTLKEFKNDPVVKDLNIRWEQAKLIDRETLASYELDDSILPVTNSIMFVTPIKTKSGVYTYKEGVAKIKEYWANGGAEKFNLIGASTETINEFCRTFIDMKTDKTSKIKLSVVSDNESLLKESVDLIEQALKKLRTVSLEATPAILNKLELYKEELAHYITKDDLQKEAETIASKFK